MADPYIYFRSSVDRDLEPGENTGLSLSFVPNGSGFSRYDLSEIYIRDDTNGGGYFTVNGTVMPAGSTLRYYEYAKEEMGPYDFLFSDFSSTLFNAGSSSGEDTIVLNGYVDGFGQIYDTSDTTNHIYTFTTTEPEPTPEPGTLSISAQQTSVTEGDSGTRAVTFEVTRSSGSDGTVSVDWEVDHGSTDYLDFSGATSGSVTFSDGQTTKYVTVYVRGDEVVEANQSFTVALSDPTNGAELGTRRSNNVTIQNDDEEAPTPEPGTLSISAQQTSVTEGDFGTRAVTFEVTRSSGSDGTVSVDWEVDHGSTDYLDFSGATSGSVTFSDGQTNKYVTVYVRGDEVVEANQYFTVALSDPTNGAELGTRRSNNVTIQNDDEEVPTPEPEIEPRIFIRDASVTEGGTLRFLVELDAPASQDIRLTYSTEYASASSAGGDYLGFTSATELVPAGNREWWIEVETLPDELEEGTEVLGLRLEEANFGIILDDYGLGQILDDYTPPKPEVSFQNPVSLALNEGAQHTVTLKLSEPTDERVEVFFDLIGISDAHATIGQYFGADIYSIPSNSVIFEPGEQEATIRLVTADDFEVEETEQFSLVLSSVNGNATISDSNRMSGVIFDNDTSSTPEPTELEQLQALMEEKGPKADFWRLADLIGAIEITPVTERLMQDAAGNLYTQTSMSIAEIMIQTDRGSLYGIRIDIEKMLVGTDAVKRSILLDYAAEVLGYATYGFDIINGVSDDFTERQDNESFFEFGTEVSETIALIGLGTLAGIGVATAAAFFLPAILTGSAATVILGTAAGYIGGQAAKWADDNDLLQEFFQSVNATIYENRLEAGLENLAFAGSTTQVLNTDTEIGDLYFGTRAAEARVGTADRDLFEMHAGNDTVGAGSGNDFIDGGAGHDVMLGRSGRDVLIGAGGNDTLRGGAGIDSLSGGRGSDRLNGGSNKDYLFGDDGSDVILGQRGNDKLHGGAGDDTLVGGGGADDFIFVGNFGHDVIRGFNVNNSNEDINLRGVASISSFMDLRANHMTQMGSDVVIDDQTGNTITLRNVSLDDLDARDFVF